MTATHITSNLRSGKLGTVNKCSYQNNFGYQTIIIKLFLFATAETHFLFDGFYYDQIDGVAMGSLLAPVLANLFISHHERTWLSNYNNSTPLFYHRYVGDIFCMFHIEQEALLFFDYLNLQHPNIKFTSENESYNQISRLS